MPAYEVITTLGPASRHPRVWQKLIAAGASSLRLNTSHLSVEQTLGWLGRLQAFFSSSSISLPVVLDLQASKWRVGTFPACTLRKDEVIELVLSGNSRKPGIIPVPHQDFFKAAGNCAGRISLSDARLELAILETGDHSVMCRVLQSGELSSHKGITCPDTTHRSTSLSDKDREIVDHTRSMDNLRYAVSYVRDVAEVAAYRDLIAKNYLIAKLERGSAITDARQIADLVDELWLCRGDLGSELGMTEMAKAVHGFTKAIPLMNVPVMLAGQVLEHMTNQATPTRAEVCGLFDALAAGYAGVVLSDETAIGVGPAQACNAAAQFRSLREFQAKP